MLLLTESVYVEIVAHAYDGLPLEACGLLGGVPTPARARRFYPTDNIAASAKVYTVDPRQHLRAERDAEAQGLEIIGVVHSHTHTVAYPSPTDVAQAPDPSWHYVIVSLAAGDPELHSYRIIGGTVTEEPVEILRVVD